MEHLDKFQQVIKDYKDDGRYRTFNDIIRKRGDYPNAYGIQNTQSKI